MACFLEGIARLKEKARKRKGRGHGAELVSTRDDVGHYESMNLVEEDDNEPGPQRCKHILSIFNYYFIYNLSFLKSYSYIYIFVMYI